MKERKVFKLYQIPFLEKGLVSLTFFIASWWLWGFYFELYESTKASLIAGSFGHPPTDYWISNWNYLLVPFWSWLSIKMPSVPIYGIWCLTLVYFAFYLLYQVYYSIIPSRRYRIIAYVITVILMSQSFIQINEIRLTLLLQALIIINYLHGKRSGVPYLWVYLILYFIVGLVRVEASFSAILIVGIYYLFTNRPLKKSIVDLLPFGLISAFTLFGYQAHFQNLQDYGSIIEHRYSYYVKNKLSSKYPDNLETHYDSIRYDLFSAGVMSDIAHITIPFLDSFINHELYLNEVKTSESLISSLKKWSLIVSKYKFYIAIISLCIFYYFSTAFYHVFVAIIVFLFTLFGVFLTDVFVGFLDRVMGSLLTITMLLLLIKVFSLMADVKRKQRFKTKFLMTTLIIVAILFVPELLETSKEYRNQELEYEHFFNEMYPTYRDGTTLVLFNPEHVEFQSVRPLANRNQIRFAPIYLWYYSFHDFANREIEDKYDFNLMNYESILRFLNSNRKKVILSTEQNMRILQRYYKEIYNESFSFKAVLENGESSDFKFIISN